MIQVPLDNNPEQLFSITLSGETFDVRVLYNTRTGIWNMSLSQLDVPVVEGVALLGGTDIFKQYNIVIKNAFVINLDKLKQDPTRENLGITAGLFILTDEELQNGTTV